MPSEACTRGSLRKPLEAFTRGSLWKQPTKAFTRQAWANFLSLQASNCLFVWNSFRHRHALTIKKTTDATERPVSFGLERHDNRSAVPRQRRYWRIERTAVPQKRDATSPRRTKRLPGDQSLSLGPEHRNTGKVIRYPGQNVVQQQNKNNNWRASCKP